MFSIPQGYIYLAVAAGAFGSGFYASKQVSDQNLLELQAQLSDASKLAAQKALKETEARISRMAKIEEEKRIQDEENARTLASASSANSGLRAQIAKLNKRISSDSFSSRECQATKTLGEISGECSEKYLEMARYATEDRLAGLTCQKLYESLLEKQK